MLTATSACGRMRMSVWLLALCASVALATELRDPETVKAKLADLKEKMARFGVSPDGTGPSGAQLEAANAWKAKDGREKEPAGGQSSRAARDWRSRGRAQDTTSSARPVTPHGPWGNRGKPAVRRAHLLHDDASKLYDVQLPDVRWRFLSHASNLYATGLCYFSGSAGTQRRR